MRAVRRTHKEDDMRPFALRFASLALVCSMQFAHAGAGALMPVDASFTYQGRLTFKGSAVDGPADLRFTLFDAATSGHAIGPAIAIPAYPVDAGLVSIDL